MHPSAVYKYIPFSPNTPPVTGFLITVLAAFVIPYNIKLGGA